jgi:hypothetical protein
MVDTNKFLGEDDNGGSSSKKTGGSSSSSSTKSGGSSSSKSKSSREVEPHSPDTSKLDDVGEASVSDTAKQWANKHSELNIDVHDEESFDAYCARQISETKELHQNILERAKENMVDLNQFTLYMHAMILVMAQNRDGIKQKLMAEFNLSEDEAWDKMEEIVSEAEEGDTIQNVIRMLANRMDDE